MVTEREPDSLRGPDIAYWSKERVPLDEVVANYPDESPDICIEILSEPRRTKALKRKLKEYFASDVRLVWVVNLEERTVTEYTAVRKSRVLTEKDLILGGNLIPGFQCRVAQVLPRRKAD
jgi:Uma2 family endonuclease